MNIGAGCHPNKVKVSGPGVAKTGLKAFEPTYFTVDCTEAGQGNAAENCCYSVRNFSFIISQNCCFDRGCAVYFGTNI